MNKKLALASITAISSFNLSAAETVGDYVMHHVQNSYEWHPWPLGHIHLPSFLSLHSVMLLIASFLLLLLFGVLYKKQPGKAPKGLTNLLEVLVLFVRDEIAIPNMGKKDGKTFTPLLLSFFFFVLTLNLLGLVPALSTATANISVTAGLATITLLFMIGGGMKRHGIIGFFKHFLPGGVPPLLYPILFPIELMGLVIKPFALTVRLFANLLAGHIVILSLIGLIISFGYIALPAIGMALAIYFLEIAVAAIQAFIFTMLSAMFIGMLLHEPH